MNHRAGILLSAMVLWAPVPAQAQSPEASDEASAAIAREQWVAHIIEAKRRVREENARRRTMIPKQNYPTTEELAQIASERVLTDSSLRFGDIVVTNRGRFEFRGKSDGDPKPQDFVKLLDP
jgi:hypothetical protein